MIRTIATDKGLYYIPYTDPFLLNNIVNVVSNPVTTTPTTKYYAIGADYSRLNTVSYPLDLGLPYKPSYYSNELDNVNNDPELKERVGRYFYDKLYDEWIFTTYRNLTKFFNIQNGNVTMVNTFADIEKTKKYNDDEVKQIIQFIKNEIMDKYDIINVIDKFVKKKNKNWFELKQKYKNDVKEYLYDKLRHHLENKVKN